MLIGADCTERFIMRKLRRIMLWLGLVFIVLLAIMSIYGAFLGAENAQKFFNAMPLPVYWAVFAVLIAVSLFAFPRMLKAPGLFAMHLGCVLIIAGSMWGSQAGHEIQRKYLGSEKVQSSQMSVVEGFIQDKVYIREGSPVNQSLANLEIDGLSLKYRYSTQTIEFVSHGEEVREEHVVIGTQIDLGIENAHIIPVRSFDNLGFKTVGGVEQAMEKPGGGSGPALEITLIDSDGLKTTKILSDAFIYNLPFFIKLNDFRIEYYSQPRVTVYDFDTKTRIWSGSPDFEEEVDLGPIYGKVTVQKGFKNMMLDGTNAVEKDGEGSNPALEILIKIPGEPDQIKYAYEDFPGYCRAGNLDIYYDRSISDYISELDVVAKSGKMIKSKAIEVNKPLYYGGYHFYQSSYQDVGNGKFATILSVTSDTGLFCVFGGFFAMCVGIVYHQNISSILKNRKNRKKK